MRSITWKVHERKQKDKLALAVVTQHSASGAYRAVAGRNGAKLCLELASSRPPKAILSGSVLLHLSAAPPHGHSAQVSVQLRVLSASAAPVSFS